MATTSTQVILSWKTVTARTGTSGTFRALMTLAKRDDTVKINAMRPISIICPDNAVQTKVMTYDVFPSSNPSFQPPKLSTGKKAY